MRLFSVMLTLVLIGALAVPFFLRGPSGQPLWSAGDVLDDVVPSTPTAMYRWRDEHGTWHFGEDLPAGVDGVAMTVDTSKTTTMGSEWNVSALVNPPAHGGGGVQFAVPDSPFSAYRAAPKVLDAARQAKDALNGRTAEMQDLLHSMKAGTQAEADDP